MKQETEVGVNGTQNIILKFIFSEIFFKKLMIWTKKLQK